LCRKDKNSEDKSNGENFSEKAKKLLGNGGYNDVKF
jgi:hypothetical protein